MKARYIIVTVFAALLLAASLYLYSGSQTPAGQVPLRNITAENISDIKNEFNAANGDVRVLLLLSPT
jgi:hypothetical protein